MIDQCVMVLMVVWYVRLVHTYNRGCVVGGGTYFWYIHTIEVMWLVRVMGDRNGGSKNMAGQMCDEKSGGRKNYLRNNSPHGMGGVLN